VAKVGLRCAEALGEAGGEEMFALGLEEVILERGTAAVDDEDLDRVAPG
jgi:hypothetical protein